ncbi:MAG TPA: hypothetical protein LFW14_02735 [Rickettsia endosymbiont of Degeeriella rufa]|nr:hypothetical protein [Rickettsia endosymbiont of Degeeriella rufa]
MSHEGSEFKSLYGTTDPALSMAAYEKHIEICKLLASHMSIPAIEDCDYKGTNLLEFVKSNSHSEKDKNCRNYRSEN